MVVLRTSIIPFNCLLHKTLGEGIGTAPWSEAPEKSLTPNRLEARGVGYKSTEAHKLHKMAYNLTLDFPDAFDNREILNHYTFHAYFAWEDPVWSTTRAMIVR